MPKYLKTLNAFLLIISIIGISAFMCLKLEIKKDNIEYEKVTEKIVNKEDYYAILEIPKINLKKELYEKTTKENDVNKNILIHKSSSFPKNIILASHSGSGLHAYFKNLYKLNIHDKINIYYDKKVYEYEIEKIEEQDKLGSLYLEDSDLILITCTKNNNKTQTIYYSSLKNIENL